MTATTTSFSSRALYFISQYSFYFPKMGRPRSTGKSHNNRASSYSSSRTGRAERESIPAGQQKMSQFLFKRPRLEERSEQNAVNTSQNPTLEVEDQTKEAESNESENESTNASSTTSENESTNDSSTTSENESMNDSSATSEADHETNRNENGGDENAERNYESSCESEPWDEKETNENKAQGDNLHEDGRSFLVTQQVREKWERKYNFAFYSHSQHGWLCLVCSEYSGSGQYWTTRAVKLGQHPNRLFKGHLESKRHKRAVKSRGELKRIVKKGSIYKQLKKNGKKVRKSVKERNRRVIKKLLKTTYFIVRKNWAVRENFEDTVYFLKDLGDEDIDHHLQECSSRATYTSVSSADEFLKCLSDYLEEGLLARVVAASDFSLLADETTDSADRADMAIFIRYVDSDTHLVKEEFLGLVEVKGSKGADALCQYISSVLREKGIDITQMRFSGLDGTNTMSGEISGLQRRLRHISPHCKYVNCRNHRLALVFVHLLPKFKALQNVDAVIIAVWKMMKYSSVKSAVFVNAQEAEGLTALKLLKAAPTRWLSHGEASQRLISRFKPLVNALDSIINEGAQPEIMGVRDQLLHPDNILFLLLLADVLTHVNRFSKFLQTANLLYVNIAHKFNQLKQAIVNMETEDGPLFNKFSVDLLTLSANRLDRGRRLRGNTLLNEDSLEDRKALFKRTVMVPYLRELVKELNSSIQVDDDVLLAFDVFNCRSNLTNEETYTRVLVLKEFYGAPCTSTFDGTTIDADAIINRDGIEEDGVKFFFEDFSNAIRKEEMCINRDILSKVRAGLLKQSQVEQYKENHPVSTQKVYAEMYANRNQYPEMMKLLKLSLLIPPSTANVERGFSSLNLLHTKQRNRLSPASLDKLIRLNLIGPAKFDDETWDVLVNKYKDMGNRRIDI